jgi:hypothetical protein
MSMLHEKELLSGLGKPFPRRVESNKASRRVEIEEAPRCIEPKYKINLEFCEHCVMGKKNRKPFGIGTHSSKEFFGYIHNDV